MRRADRLFRIVRVLRGGRLQTAKMLAEKLEVSERTIYRDVRDLQSSGMPIEGEAGVGYTLRRDLDLPPLMFTRDELTALVLGARMVQAWGGAACAASADQALQRIEAVLPAELRERLDSILMYAPGHRMVQPLKERLDVLHDACVGRRAVAFRYAREDGQSSVREVRPLALYFWGGAWTLAAWCELRKDFRVFRIDRMEEVEVLKREFVQKKGQRLEDFVRQAKKDAAVYEAGVGAAAGRD
ncbi:YafY family protein [Granulicella sp. S190]|uniref:helix-turn-helix transcriptional regulator n=1 Tax=Granulicella sp. S190 TaxID=1747226 RepID=UPI00131B5A1D|nr:YafY family protein [Granulicella sp. S190]